MGQTRQSTERLQPHVNSTADVTGGDQPRLAGLVCACTHCPCCHLDLVEPEGVWTSKDNQ